MVTHRDALEMPSEVGCIIAANQRDSESLYVEDGCDWFLRNFRSYKNHTASFYPRMQQTSAYNWLSVRIVSCSLIRRQLGTKFWVSVARQEASQSVLNNTPGYRTSFLGRL